MKRIIMLFSGLTFCFSMFADKYTEMAQKHLDWIKAGQADSVLAHSDAELRTMLPAAAIQSVWPRFVAQIGELKEQKEWKRSTKDKHEVCKTTLVFEKESLCFLATFDTAMRLVGVSFVPASEVADEANTEKPLPDGVEEREFAVKHGKVNLPGKITLPKGVEGDVPVVVLVHGSGPNDMDESVGPNRPFRDLAVGLAQKGIAVLRYDKRTKVYGNRTAEVSGGKLNYDSESVDDALQALRQVEKLPGIDAKRVYVLGHSLGGMLLPRIAVRSELKLAGLIALAAAARPLDQMMYEQVMYISQAYGQTADSAQVTAREFVKKMNSMLPTEYKAMQKTYDPFATVKRLKNKPVLFLQGTHDYQVTEEDLSLWKKALTENSNAQFTVMKDLDHLFRKLPRMALPADYEQAGTMSDEAIAAVARFVLDSH